MTPSLNQGRYIEQTIRSILLQGYPALEYYIEDAGSTDETLAIIKKYEPFISGWVSEKDRGQSHAINKGMARMRQAEWVNWVNSDDVLLPGALRAVGEWALKRTGAVAVIGGEEHFIERSGQVVTVKRSQDLDGISLRNWKTHSFLQTACFFSRRAFEECGGVNESLHYAMDFELWVKLGEMGRFDLIETTLARDRYHDAAKTASGMGLYFGEACEVLFSRNHAKEGRALVRDLYNEYAYLCRMLRPFTGNRFYLKFIQPWIRRRYAPDHLKRKAQKDERL